MLKKKSYDIIPHPKQSSSLFLLLYNYERYYTLYRFVLQWCGVGYTEGWTLWSVCRSTLLFPAQKCVQNKVW